MYRLKNYLDEIIEIIVTHVCMKIIFHLDLNCGREWSWLHPSKSFRHEKGSFLTLRFPKKTQKSHFFLNFIKLMCFRGTICLILSDDLLQNEKVGSKFEQNPTTIPTRESKIQQNVKSTQET